MRLKKELELQDWSRDRSSWDWLQGRGWQRGRKEGLLVSAVRGDEKERITERCKQEESCRNLKGRAEKGETGFLEGERDMSRQNLEIKFKLEQQTNKIA